MTLPVEHTTQAIGRSEPTPNCGAAHSDTNPREQRCYPSRLDQEGNTFHILHSLHAFALSTSGIP